MAVKTRDFDRLPQFSTEVNCKNYDFLTVIFTLSTTGAEEGLMKGGVKNVMIASR